MLVEVSLFQQEIIRIAQMDVEPLGEEEALQYVSAVGPGGGDEDSVFGVGEGKFLNGIENLLGAVLGAVEPVIIVPGVPVCD